MTLRQAEAWLALKPSARGRRLKRILMAVERKTGRVVMTRLGERGMRVTRSALRRFCRHLIPSHVDELRERFAEFLRGIDARIEASVAEHVAEHVEPEFDRLWRADEIQAAAIKELAIRVNRLAGITGKADAKGREGTGLSTKGETRTRGRSDRPGKPQNGPEREAV